MKKISVPLTKQSVVQGAKVAGVALAGAVIAQVGSDVAKRMSAQVAAFAAKNNGINEAIVDSVAGIGLSTAGLVVVGKVSTPRLALGLAPFVYGGVLVSAWAPAVTPRIVGAIMNSVNRFLPAGNGGELPRGNGGDVPHTSKVLPCKCSQPSVLISRRAA